MAVDVVVADALGMAVTVEVKELIRVWVDVGEAVGVVITFRSGARLKTIAPTQ